MSSPTQGGLYRHLFIVSGSDLRATDRIFEPSQTYECFCNVRGATTSFEHGDKQQSMRDCLFRPVTNKVTFLFSLDSDISNPQNQVKNLVCDPLPVPHHLVCAMSAKQKRQERRWFSNDRILEVVS